jgi:hypothetical protein
MNRKVILLILLILIQIPCYSQINSGWDFTKLKNAEDYSHIIGTFAFILMTDGKVIKAWGDTVTPSNLQSARKAISSMIYNIYLGKGKGRLDPDKTLAELGIDDYPNPLTDIQKQAKVIHLIKSISGINHNADAEIQQMRDDKNHRLGINPNIPGTKWAYNNWDYNTLNTIFEQEIQISEKEAFFKNIVYPLGMHDIDDNTITFTKDTSVSVHPAIQYSLSARDMAKFGQLCLNNGNWKETQLVPEEYFRKITTDFTKTGMSGLDSGHGYMWWIPCDNIAKEMGIPAGTYHASGVGAQHIIIIPEWNTVIVHKSFINANEGIILYAKQEGYSESFVMENLSAIVDELVDFIYNKCKEPEYMENEICKKCRIVDDSDFNKLLQKIINAKIK